MDARRQDGSVNAQSSDEKELPANPMPHRVSAITEAPTEFQPPAVPANRRKSNPMPVRASAAIAIRNGQGAVVIRN